MTLRPEPILALLFLLSLALAIRFRRGERGWVLVAWALVLGLGITSHPVGVVVVAPLLVSWRALLDWVRSGRPQRVLALTFGLMVVAVTMLAFFLDSGLSIKLEAMESFQQGPFHGRGVFDELQRYSSFFDHARSTALRRAAFVFMAGAAGR